MLPDAEAEEDTVLQEWDEEPSTEPPTERRLSIEPPPAATEEEEQAGKGDAAMMCVPVVLRIGIIDYLRAWSITERFEHVQKSITRDLLAGGQRNHAVVPVREFECTGASAPFDHPHIFLDMGSETEIVCPYCSTRYRYRAAD